MKAVKNFAQFFSLFNKMENADEELKCELVGTFTAGRTTSLREMEPEEYNRMCESLRAAQYGQTDADFKAEIKALRSAVLKRLQKMGIDTTDWAKVDNFCLNPRIAGKMFRHLSKEDLKALIPKLSAISVKDSKKPAIEKLSKLPMYMLN
jgi:hypothetical protein